MKAAAFYSGSRKLVCRFLALGLLLGCGLVRAESVGWEQLSAKEQQVLQEYRGSWQTLPDATRLLLRSWAGLSAQQQRQIRQRHQEWLALPPASRTAIIRKLERYKHLPLQQRLRIVAWHAWVKKLPGKEQQQLRQRWP
ncbi:MAG: DUF3106 domain-containing protein, partial [Thiothrix sp.]|nr:DUF3106 domain-containing protein [Thiothrix sp.]